MLYSSQGWRAQLEITDTGRTVFRLSGEVELPNPSYDAELVLRDEPGPGKEIVEVEVLTRSSGGVAPAALQWRTVNFSYPGERIRGAAVYYNDDLLARVMVDDPDATILAAPPVDPEPPVIVDLGIDGFTNCVKIGEGGFASVYAADHTRYGRRVAIKILDRVDASGRRRFETELFTMGQLTAHPNVVVPYSDGYTNNNYPYLVMEYLEGGSLADQLAATGPIGWEQAVDWLLPIADALGYGHSLARPILHRDVKPENILLDGNGTTKLTDYGIASIRDATRSMTGVAFTLAHAAPETFSDGSTQRDERSDLYSLASTLYTLIEGREPYAVDPGTEDSHPAYMARILNHPVPHASHGPDALNDFLQAALAKEPDRRLQDAREFVAELHLVRSDTPAPPVPVDPPRLHIDRLLPVADPITEPDLGDGEDVAGRETEVDPSLRTPESNPRSARPSWLPLVAVGVASLLLLGLVALVAGRDDNRVGGDGGEEATGQDDETPEATSSADGEPAPSSGSSSGSRQSAAPEEVVYSNHQGGTVRTVALLTGGLVASGGADGAVRVWDPDTGDTITTYTGHTSTVRSVIQLTDGTIASASTDDTVQIWDPDTGDIITTYTEHTGSVTSVIQLTDGTIASASDDDTVQIWDPDTGDTITTYTEHTGSVNSVIQLTDGTIASASDDDTVQIWDPDTGNTITTYTGHTSTVNSLIQLTDGNIASGSNAGTVQIWDPDTGDNITTYTEHTDWVRWVIQLTDGNIASASDDDTVQVWDPDTGDNITTYTGHTSWVYSVIQLTDGTIASASRDGAVQIWDPDTGDIITTYTEHTSIVRSVTQLTDGTIASASDDDTVQIWDPDTGDTITTYTEHTGSVNSVIQLTDGTIASASEDDTVQIWDPDTGNTITTYTEHTSWVNSVIQLTDGNIASSSNAGTVQIWDPDTGDTITTYTEHTDWVRWVIQLTDGTIASASDDDTVQIWDPDTGNTITTYTGHTSWVYSVIQLTDGSIASASDDDTVQIWDPDTGSTITTYTGHTDDVWSVTQLTDGTIASASRDGTVQIWDPDTGNTITTYTEHTRVFAVIELDDGRIASGGADAVRVWDPNSLLDLSRALKVGIPQSSQSDDRGSR